MLKIYLRKLLEEYLDEIDLTNATTLVMMDVEDLLIEIIEDIIYEKFIEEFLFVFLLTEQIVEKREYQMFIK